MSTLNPGVLYQRTQVKMKKKYSFFFFVSSYCPEGQEHWSSSGFNI